MRKRTIDTARSTKWKLLTIMLFPVAFNPDIRAVEMGFHPGEIAHGLRVDNDVLEAGIFPSPDEVLPECPY